MDIILLLAGIAILVYSAYLILIIVFRIIKFIYFGLIEFLKELSKSLLKISLKINEFFKLTISYAIDIYNYFKNRIISHTRDTYSSGNELISNYHKQKKIIISFYDSIINDIQSSFIDTKVTKFINDEITFYKLDSVSNRYLTEIIEVFKHFDTFYVNKTTKDEYQKTVKLRSLKDHSFIQNNIKYVNEVNIMTKETSNFLCHKYYIDVNSKHDELFSIFKLFVQIEKNYKNTKVKELLSTGLSKKDLKLINLQKIKTSLLNIFSTHTPIIKNLRIETDSKKIVHYDYEYFINNNFFIRLRTKIKQGDIIGLGFDNIQLFIKHIINPVWGSISNINDKQHYFYVSLGSSSSSVTKFINTDLLELKKLHYLCWDYIGLNVGYDKYSYILYIFHEPNRFKVGDAIIFGDLHDNYKFTASESPIVYDGTFQIENAVNSNVISANTISFTPIRIDIEELRKIQELNKFNIYHYIEKDENVYELKSSNYYLHEEISDQVFIEMIKKLPINESFEMYVNSIKDEIVYVYVMKDINTGFFKIGISNNPKYREKTLLSQSPNVKLIHKRGFNNRSLAKRMEKSLHNHFKIKRGRGEWFDLDENDINELKSYLGL